VNESRILCATLWDDHVATDMPGTDPRFRTGSTDRAALLHFKETTA
jgi:hypothetical protein